MMPPETMPGIDMTAYYQGAGTGGTVLARNNNPEVPGGYGDALGQLGNLVQPTWNVSVVVSYPIGTSAQEANHARAKVQYQQALADPGVTEKLATLGTSVMNLNTAQFTKFVDSEIRTSAVLFKAAGIKPQ